MSAVLTLLTRCLAFNSDLPTHFGEYLHSSACQLFLSICVWGGGKITWTILCFTFWRPLFVSHWAFLRSGQKTSRVAWTVGWPLSWTGGCPLVAHLLARCWVCLQIQSCAYKYKYLSLQVCVLQICVRDMCTNTHYTVQLHSLYWETRSLWALRTLTSSLRPYWPAWPCC